MTERPFHHGNLRTVLLDRAEVVLRERGVDALSLRELARDAGVSHGAPRSHFIDREALLDALAQRGFERLADAITAAVTQNDGDHARILRAAGSAFVDFAVRDAALLEIMFAAKVDAPSPAVTVASERLFSTMSSIVQQGIASGVLKEREPVRMSLLLSSTTQGIAALIGSRRITPEMGELLLDELLDLVLARPRE